jgi:hypothetical protein
MLVQAEALGTLNRLHDATLARSPGARGTWLARLPPERAGFCLHAEPVSVRLDSFRYRATKFVHRVAALSIALIAISLCVGIAGTLWEVGRAVRSERQARAAAARRARLRRYLRHHPFAPFQLSRRSQPRDTNDTLEGRACNRRVELMKIS